MWSKLRVKVVIHVGELLMRFIHFRSLCMSHNHRCVPADITALLRIVHGVLLILEFFHRFWYRVFEPIHQVFCPQGNKW